MVDFLMLAEQCAPDVHADTMRRIVTVESSFNPFAIGVVGGRLDRQPRSHAEALAAIRALEAGGFDYSVGLAQVNRRNFARQGLKRETAFDPCANLAAGSAILKDCFLRAASKGRAEQAALRDAFSCYYSGNFVTGYRHGYVTKVVASSASPARPRPVVPEVRIPAAEVTVPPQPAPVPLRAKAAASRRQAAIAPSAREPEPSEPPTPRSALLF